MCLLAYSTTYAAPVIYAYEGKPFDGNIFDEDPPSGSYTSSMRLSGTLVLSGPLIPSDSPQRIIDDVVAYSFSDGRNTLTQDNSVLFEPSSVRVNDAGLFDAWDIQIGSGTSIFDPCPQDDLVEDTRYVCMSAFGNVESNNGADRAETYECSAPGCRNLGFDVAESNLVGTGTWTIVPIPAAVWLFGSALGLLGWLRRKQAQLSTT